MSERTTLYLYRGVIILWCHIVPEQGASTFTTTWEIDERCHWSGVYTDLDDALTEACRDIDRQLAGRPPTTDHRLLSIVYQPPTTGRKPNIPELVWYK